MRALHVTSVNRLGRIRPLGRRAAVAVFLPLMMGVAARAAEPVISNLTPTPAAQAGAATRPAGPAPQIGCDEPEFNFPESWSGEKIEHTFILKNTGEGPLEITRVQPGCGCTLAGEFDRNIAPGKTGKVPVALKTDGMRGPVTKSITVFSNDPAKPQLLLHIKGTIKSAIDMQPLTGFSWSQINPQSPDSITVTLTNNTDQPWNLALKPAEPAQQTPQSAFDVKIKEIEKGRKAEVTASLKKPLKEGSTIAQFTFTTGLTRQPEYKINANYYLPPALQVMPAAITGFSVPGQEYRATLTVAYSREGSMQIMEVSPSDPAIRTEINQPTPGDSRRYTVTVTLPKDFSPTPASPASIKIKTDKTELANGGVLTVPINVRPQVVQPTAQQMIGKPAPQSSLKTPAGSEVKIGAPSDSITVVNYWATWCGFCKRQVPVLEGIHKQYASKGVKFVNVSVDTQKAPKDVEEASKQLGSTMPIALDPKGETATKWGARGWPALFVVNKQGVIEAFHSGAAPTLAKDLSGELDLLLQGKPLPRTTVASATTQPATPPPPPTPQVKGPSLLIDALRQDIGLRKPGENLQYSLSVRNNGTDPVEIKDIKPGSDAVKLDANNPKTIAPGAAAMIRLDIKVPTQPGTFQETLTLRSTDPNRAEQTVTFAGTVRKYVEVQTQTPDGVVTFPRNPRTQDIPSLATIVYNGEGSIEYGKPESSSPKFEATIEPIPNGPYSKLIIKARPPLEQGENNAVIHIKTSCKAQPELDVPVKFFLPPRVEVTPKEVLLTPTGRLQRSLVVIRNNGDKSLSILGVKASSKRINWQFFPESDGLSYKLMVTIPSAPAGEATPAAESVTVRTDDPEFGEIVIPIKFSSADAQGPAAAAR